MTYSNLKNISKIKGKSYSRSFVFKDKNGDPINLTGSIIKFSMKINPGDTEHISLTELTITDAVNGKASLLISMNMDVGKYFYEFEWTDSLGYKNSIENGTMNILSSIT